MIIILLPAYNEEISFPPLMEKLKHTLEEINEDYRLVVCNDGSDDNTSVMLEEYSAKFHLKSLSTA
jgi:dolichol-phosphate mannosyltransferase